MGGSGGEFRAPCPIGVAVSLADKLQACATIALIGNPELCRHDRLGEMQQIRAAAEFQDDPDPTGLRFLGGLKGRLAIGRMASHDGDEDHAIRGEVPLMQREGR